MKYSRSPRIAEYAGENTVRHPMLIHGAGIATIAAACTSALNALSLSMIMLVLCAAMSVVYMFERGEYIQPMRTIVYLVPSITVTFMCGLVLNALSPQTAESLGMYIPILAADSIVLAWLEEDAPFIPPTQALPEALSLWWMYAVLALPIGMLREIIGSGSIFGYSFSFTGGASGMEYPFAGFIMLGFGLAIIRKLRGDDSE